MARISEVLISNYRSVEDLRLVFPTSGPLILLGPNNAGKSNIARAIQLPLGPFYPSNHEPEDHEFFSRDRSRVICIEIDFDNSDLFGGRYSKVVWRYNKTADPPVYYRGLPGQRGFPDGWISNEDRDSCTCVVLEADRNLNYQLGYSSKWTLLSRLMTRFHRTLEGHESIRSDLELLFSEIKAKFHEIPEFADFITGLRDHMADLVSTMSHRLEVDFEAYNPVNFFHALRLQAAEGGNARTLEEMGTGEQQILAMAFAHAFAKAFHTGILLVIEEPESHLHPLAQSWLAKRLAKMTTGDLQVIITTHSAAFVDVLNLEGLCLVRKDEFGTDVTQVTRQELVAHSRRLGAEQSRAKAATILQFYRSNASREVLEGFFAKLVVLVEGPTEAFAIPTYLSRLGLDCEKAGVAVVPVQGKGNVAKWQRLFSAFEIPTYIVFDNDGKKDDRDGAKRKDALRSVGVSENDDLEQLTAADGIVIEETYLIFAENFEKNLRSLFARYEEVEEQVTAGGVDSKPFVARAVAEQLPYDPDDAGWKLFTELKGRLVARLAE